MEKKKKNREMRLNWIRTRDELKLDWSKFCKHRARAGYRDQWLLVDAGWGFPRAHRLFLYTALESFRGLFISIYLSFLSLFEGEEEEEEEEGPPLGGLPPSFSLPLSSTICHNLRHRVCAYNTHVECVETVACLLLSFIHLSTHIQLYFTVTPGNKSFARALSPSLFLYIWWPEKKRRKNK